MLTGGGIILITFDLYHQEESGKENQELDQYMGKYSNMLDRAREGEERFSDSLGWLDPSRWAGEETLSQVESLAGRIRSDAEAFVIVGVGGSLNAARAVIEALHTKGPKIMYMGNTLSGHALSSALDFLRGKRFYINCIAKNFETLEPGASFRLLRCLLKEQYGPRAADHIFVTGTPGSRLEEICRQEGYTFLTFPEDVGGRYTALSNVGLFPMAVAGIDIRSVAEGAKSMKQELFTQPAHKNTALRYASLRNLLYEKGYRVELLACFEPQFENFFKWWVQLFAESEGKDGKGLFPAAAGYSEELHSLGQYVQEGTPLLFETFLSVEEPAVILPVPEDNVDDGFSYLDGTDFHRINKEAFEATRKAHSERLPCLTFHVERTDEQTFGELFYFFQFACYLSGCILDVDPFDQPGVEAYKSSMFEALGKGQPGQDGQKEQAVLRRM